MNPGNHITIKRTLTGIEIGTSESMEAVFDEASRDPSCNALLDAIDAAEDDDMVELLFAELGNRLERIARRMFPD